MSLENPQIASAVAETYPTSNTEVTLTDPVEIWPVPGLKDTLIRCEVQTGGGRWSSEGSSAESSNGRRCG